MLQLGRKANRGTLAAPEEAEYRSLMEAAERRSAKAALAAVASRDPPRAAALAADFRRRHR
jgi:hypothetical protein